MNLKFNAAQAMTSALEYSFAEDLDATLGQCREAIKATTAAIVDYHVSGKAEDLMDELEEIFSEGLGRFEDHQAVATYFDNTSISRVSRAVYKLIDCRRKILNTAQVGATLTAGEVADCILILQFVMSELIGATLITLDCFDRVDEVTAAERSGSLLVSQGLNAFIQDLGKTPSKYVQELADMSYEFSVSFPVRLIDPEFWDSYCDFIASCGEYSEQIREFDDEMTMPDCRAIMSKKVPVDDDLVTMLQQRHEAIESGDDVRQSVPHQFQTMLELIPEDKFDIVLKYERFMTPQFVREVVSGTAIDAKLLATLGSIESQTRFFS